MEGESNVYLWTRPSIRFPAFALLLTRSLRRWQEGLCRMRACVCRAGGGPRRWCARGSKVVVVFDHLKDIAHDGEQLAAQVRRCHISCLGSGRCVSHLGVARSAIRQ